MARSASRVPSPDPAEEQVNDAAEGDLDQAGDRPRPLGQETYLVGPDQVGQAEDFPADHEGKSREENKRGEHGTPPPQSRSNASFIKIMARRATTSRHRAGSTRHDVPSSR